jgi:hypothetical protein
MTMTNHLLGAIRPSLPLDAPQRWRFTAAATDWRHALRSPRSCRWIRSLPGVGIPFEDWTAEFGWDCVDLETGHDAMVVTPAELADMLLEVVNK